MGLSIQSRGALVVLLSFFTLIFSQSHALAADEVFTPDDEIVIGEKETYEQIQDSVFRGHYTSPFHIIPGQCTNTFISNEGHFVTALHCLRSCLEQHDAISGIFASIVSPRTGKQSGFVLVNHDIMKEKSCIVEDPETGETVEAKFIAAGPGFAEGGRGPLFPLAANALSGKAQKAAEAVMYGFSNNLDFAVLQWPKKKTSCAKAVGPEVKDLVDSNLWTMSYPSNIGWENDTVSDGKTRLVSQGKVLSSYTEVPQLVEMASKIKLADPTLTDKLRKLIFDIDSMHLTTVPATPGSSGASVFNKQGEIEGIASFIYFDNEAKVKKPDVTYMVKMNEIRKYLNEYYQEAEPDKLFNCQ